MSDRKIKALEGSVEKWQNIVDGGLDKGAANCPLCREFGCTSCPVMKDTGHRDCDYTPYKDWFDHHESNKRCDPNKASFKVVCEKCKELAIKERDYLQGLLDKERKID